MFRTQPQPYGNTSTQTIICRLRQNGIRTRSPVQRTALRLYHGQARLLWANGLTTTYRDKTRQQRSQVLCTDESRFFLVAMMVECMYTAVGMKGWKTSMYGQVTVWGGITTDHSTALEHILAALYVANFVATNLQQQHAVSFMQNRPGYILRRTTPRSVVSGRHKLTSQENKSMSSIPGQQYHPT
ncbi:transposable element tc1 transposase [Plakobranchus ocellatus]|uniref:Transposable element tc1 transposase n=1 Tax=Plakobranchus ocellatus TaxID=259542 RepID=A0AAV3Z423_9GAST|nr:transposable element tc1 transposase [Plakobranchus ocellatus]